jgi:hypothetical protein
MTGKEASEGLRLKIPREGTKALKCESHRIALIFYKFNSNLLFFLFLAGSWNVAQTGLKLEPPVSAFWVLGLQECPIKLGSQIYSWSLVTF